MEDLISKCVIALFFKSPTRKARCLKYLTLGSFLLMLLIGALFFKGVTGSLQLSDRILEFFCAMFFTLLALSGVLLFKCQEEVERFSDISETKRRHLDQVAILLAAALSLSCTGIGVWIAYLLEREQKANQEREQERIQEMLRKRDAGKLFKINWTIFTLLLALDCNSILHETCPVSGSVVPSAP